MGCNGGCGGNKSIGAALFASAAHESFVAMVEHTYSVPLFGTLLGLEREGDLISRDYDLDFYSPLDPIETVPPGLFKSYEERYPDGRLTQTALQNSKRKKLFIDVFQPVDVDDEHVSVRIVHRRKPKGTTSYLFPRVWLTELEMVDYDWCETLMPVHRRLILERVYGSDWEKPIHNWRHPRD